jgi:hypothetical protein
MVGVRRIGRSVTLITTEDQTDLLLDLATRLSAAEELQDAIYVDVARGRLRELRKGVVQVTEESLESTEPSEIVGWLLSAGHRVYDKAAPRSVEHLAFGAFAPAGDASPGATGGKLKALAFRKAEEGEIEKKAKERHKRRQKKRKKKA